MLEEADKIFIVTKDYNDKVVNFLEQNFNEIDPDLLPLETAFCPDIDKEVVNNFEKNYLPFVSLKHIDTKFYYDTSKIVWAHIENDKFVSKIYNTEIYHHHISYDVLPVYKYRSRQNKKARNVSFNKITKKTLTNV